MNFRGNAPKYKDSPMARLLEEYTGGTDGNELSTETTVTILVTIVDLVGDNIEKVEDPNRSMTKYKLKEGLMDNLRKTTIELQEFIERARSLLSPWYSARLISEFDILAESARNIMGIVFLLLCLVIPYRVRPESVKKKLNSVECPVDFHGTSPRSSHEIIHVMISHANLNM